MLPPCSGHSLKVLRVGLSQMLRMVDKRGLTSRRFAQPSRVRGIREDQGKQPSRARQEPPSTPPEAVQNFQQRLKNEIEKLWQASNFGRSLRPPSHLWRALLFTGGTAVATFTWAATQNPARQMMSEAERMIEEWAKAIDREMRGMFRELPSFSPYRVQELSPGEKVIMSIIAVNVAVWLAWKAPALQRIMYRYFTNCYASMKPLVCPMLLSAFSHKMLLHLFLNMYVLHSFGHAAVDKFLGAPQFLAFYLTAGAFASFVSLAHKSVTRSMITSLGASGAILALVIYACMKMPDAQLGIVFIPGFNFSARTAVYGTIAFDVFGLMVQHLKGHSPIDHAAHLGGALFGLWYAMYGERIYREKVVPAVRRYYTVSRRDSE